MGLFENGRSANIKSTVAMVEDVLVELGYFLNDCREAAPGDALHAWTVRKGSALVRIQVVDEARTAFTIRVVSVVMTIDASVDELALFRHLLTLNDRRVQGAAFALHEDQVLLLTERSTLDLDRSEVLDLIQRVRTYADDHDDVLVARFGGVMGTGEPA